MIDELLEKGSAMIQWDIRLTILLLVLSLFICTGLITSIRSRIAIRAQGNDKTPPVLPYSIPVLGNLFAFAFDTQKLLNSLIKKYGKTVPVRLRILNQKLYFISGAENVLELFKGSRDLTTKPSTILVLENAFGQPASDRDVYIRDDTGVYTQPLPGSNDLEPHNRIFSLGHKTLHRNLAGNSLADLATRFMTNLEGELNALDVGDEWTDVPDFYAIVQQCVFKASTTAICGPHLFQLNPDFITDFWTFDTHVPNLFRGLPKWLIPSAFRCRDKLKNSITKWHKFASEHVDAEDKKLRDVEWEEYFGARLMRERAVDFSGVDGLSAESWSASDLGMIWGANANIVPIVGWELLDLLLRPDVLSAVLDECNSAVSNAGMKSLSSSLNMPTLLASPLLLSIYSEELRLRNGVIIQRVPVVDTFKIGPWKFPSGRMIIASSWHEGRDKNVWNEGPVNGITHDVEDFWAERFIIYPNDPSTGPRKPDSLPSKSRITKSEKSASEVQDIKDNKPKFTNEPVTGSFIPYGGGVKICPGRHYAKQEAIGAMALFLMKFEIELVGETELKPNLDYFPFGVVPPKGKFPARMRRRKAGGK